MTTTIRPSLAILLLCALSFAGCEELPADTALDTGAEAIEPDEAADEAADDDATDEAIAWGSHYYCTTTGSLDSGWYYDGGTTYDFARARATWSGSAIDGVGTITVSTTLNGLTYTTAPDTLALTGAVKVNGNTCGSVSVIDRDRNYDAKATGSCTMSWSAPATTTVKVQDSASGMRAEFIRGSTTTRFYAPNSGSSTLTCWWG